jgi:hypothetical protein
MKYFAAAAILAMLASPAAWGQVYGGEDDPYQQSPFASNSYVPPPAEQAQPATATPAAPAPVTSAPATEAATPAPAAAATTNSAKPQQAAASSQPAKTQPQN